MGSYFLSKQLYSGNTDTFKQIDVKVTGNLQNSTGFRFCVFHVVVHF